MDQIWLKDMTNMITYHKRKRQPVVRYCERAAPEINYSENEVLMRMVLDA
jgi:hypothetical protein